MIPMNLLPAPNRRLLGLAFRLDTMPILPTSHHSRAAHSLREAAISQAHLS